jgi:hypothetical protein
VTKKHEKLVNAITAARSSREGAFKSSKVAETDGAFRRLTARLKQNKVPEDVQAARDESAAQNVRAAHLDKVAWIGERVQAGGRDSYKVMPEQCASAFDEAKRRNPSGNYTSWCAAAGKKLGVSGKTISNYVPNPKTRKEP